jgi:hypothetical protein
MFGLSALRATLSGCPDEGIRENWLSPNVERLISTGCSPTGQGQAVLAEISSQVSNTTSAARIGRMISKQRATAAELLWASIEAWSVKRS